MFGDIGAPELLIILAIVLVLFGAGRVGRLGKDLGTAVKDFRSAVTDEDDNRAVPPQTPAVVLLAPVSSPISASFPPGPQLQAADPPPAAPGSSDSQMRPPAIF